MALAHFEKAEGLATQLREKLLQTTEKPFKKPARVAVSVAQAEPEILPPGGQALAKLYCQRAFAEPGRRTDQQQPP
jgi:NADH dehydrogenase FAD-containing subunit